MPLVVSKYINGQFLKTRNYTRAIIKLTLFSVKRAVWSHVSMMMNDSEFVGTKAVQTLSLSMVTLGHLSKQSLMPLQK